jgi:hypothetical protein
MPPATGWLVGLDLGVRGWSSAGYPSTTTSYGLAGGWAYAHGVEVDGRLVLLGTREKTSGFGISAVHTWKLPLDDYERYQLILGAGAGFETQSNELRISRRFFFARAAPGFRWFPTSHVALNLGPDVGFGSITAAPDPGTASIENGSGAFALYYGLDFSIVWLIDG